MSTTSTSLDPGVDVATEIETLGTKTFALTLVDGKYSFMLRSAPDPDERIVHGRASPCRHRHRLQRNLLSGSTSQSRQRRCTLTTPAGKPVKALAAGPAVITVRDRSAVRGVRLAGAGVGRSTTVRFVGTVTWKVNLSAGTLVYGSDARKPVLKGGRVPVS